MVAVTCVNLRRKADQEHRLPGVRLMPLDHPSKNAEGAEQECGASEFATRANISRAHMLLHVPSTSEQECKEHVSLPHVPTSAGHVCYSTCRARACAPRSTPHNCPHLQESSDHGCSELCGDAFHFGAQRSFPCKINSKRFEITASRFVS